MADTLKDIILTEGTPTTGVTKKLQILLKRKDSDAWE